VKAISIGEAAGPFSTRGAFVRFRRAAAKGHVGQGGTKSPYRFYRSAHVHDRDKGEKEMGRYVLLWLLGVPIPILLLVWMFGGLN